MLTNCIIVNGGQETNRNIGAEGKISKTIAAKTNTYYDGIVGFRIQRSGNKRGG